MMQEQIDISDQVGVKVVKGGANKETPPPKTPEEQKKEMEAAQKAANEEAKKMVDVEVKLNMMNGLKMYLEQAAKRGKTTFEELIVSLAWDMARLYALIPPEEIREIVVLKKKEQELLAKHRKKKSIEAHKAEARKKRKEAKQARKNNR